MNTLVGILEVDEALEPAHDIVCAAVEAQEYPRHRNKRATRFPVDYRLMTTDPPPNNAAYADEGDANLAAFISCLLDS